MNAMLNHRRARRHILAALLTVLALLSLAPAEVAGNPDINFDPATVIDSVGTAQHIRTPFAVTGRDGTVYVIYTVESGTGQFWSAELRMARSTDRAATWQTRAILSGQVRSPSVAIGPANEIYVAYLQGSQCYEVSPYRCDGSQPIFPAMKLIKSVDGGTTFSAPIQVSSPGMTAVYPGQVAVDPHGKVYVLWSEGMLSTVNLNLGGPTSLLLAGSGDGVRFDSPVTVASGEFYACGSATCQEIFRDSHFAISGNGTMQALWTAYYQGEIRLARLSDGGSPLQTSTSSPAYGIPTGNPGLVGGPEDQTAYTWLVDSCAYTVSPPCNSTLGITIDDGLNSNGDGVTDQSEGEMGAALAFDSKGTLFVAYDRTSYTAPRGSFEYFAQVSPRFVGPFISGSTRPTLLSTIPATGFPGSAQVAQETVTAYEPGHALVAWVEAEESVSGLFSGYKLLARRQSPCPDVLGNGNGDADGDSLCDDWEINGIKDADGNMLLDLPAMGADPNHKDVFVEIDYMDCALGGCAPGDSHTHFPSPNVLQRVVTAFDHASVNNPDGEQGIHLHLMLDEPVPEVSPLFWADGDQVTASNTLAGIKLGGPSKQPCALGTTAGHFGTQEERSSPDCQAILDARALVFHYALITHELVFSDPPDAGTVFDPDTAKYEGGLGELPGNDLAVATGVVGKTEAADGFLDIQLMHELGHNFNLDHGGGDPINCKPNYLSIMNYSYAIPDIAAPTPTGFPPLDYSRQKLPTLDMLHLNELIGIQGPPGSFVIYGANGFVYSSDLAALPKIDWNHDGQYEQDVTNLDLDTADYAGCSGVLQRSTGTLLQGYDDWSNLLYDFRGAQSWAASLSTFPHAHQHEPTVEEINAIVPPRQSNQDTTPPTTTVSTTPAPNAAGWNNTDVTLAFTASDNSDGSGQKEIVYATTGALNNTLTVAGATASLAITAEGTTTITYFSRDNAGNAEAAHTLVVRIDKTPPSITATRSPQPNAAGWNNTDVAVSFACADTLSGIDRCSPTQIASSEGAGQALTGTATDQAGNAASVTVENINIDTTAPTLACAATPTILWPPNNKLVPVGTSIGVQDSLSGALGFELTSITSSEPDSGQGDVRGWQVGAPSTSGDLRATRLGSGTGRTYTLSYSGSDQAGNTSTCTVIVSVPHDNENR